MYDTLKCFQSLIDTELAKLSLEDLALMYQTNPTSTILATAYFKIYRLVIVVNQNFWGLDDSDYASYCVEKLHFCLLNYDSQCKFATYFITVYRNKLREETEKLNYKKRKGLLCSINDLLETGVEDTYNLLEMILPKNLTDKEYKVCMMKSEGYDNKDCAEELHVSKMTISNIEKSLKNKLATLQNL